MPVLLLLVLALLAAACGSSAGEARRSAAPASVAAPAPAPLLAMRFDGPPRLFRVDPRTLQRTSRELDVRGGAGVSAFSPDRRTLALGSGSSPVLRFVDVGGMRWLGRLDLRGTGPVTSISWPRRDRLLALVQAEPSRVAVVDPRARRLVRVVELDGTVHARMQAGGRLVVLLAPPRRIGPARLGVVAADGSLRSVALPGVRAGGERFDDGTDTPGYRSLAPGLAVDAAGGRAFVVPPGRRVLEIDLATLSVTEHALAQPVSLLGRLRDWVEPPAHAKSLEGPYRAAAWFAGSLVVGGLDYGGLRDGRLVVTDHGVKLVDTRTWGVRTLDSEASDFALAAGRLLLFGARFDAPGNVGVGVDAYDAAGRPVFELLGKRRAYLTTAGRYAYVSELNSRRHTIIDVAAGRVLRTVDTRGPQTLITGGL